MSPLKLPLPIPLEHPCYEDHFPGNPLVPGALLLKWIFDLLASEANGIRPACIASIKFLAPAHPGDACELSVDENSNKLKIICRKADVIVLKGTLNKS